MKSRHLALLSLLALSCAASGQSTNPQLFPQGDANAEVFTFKRSGIPYQLELCATEICTADATGALKIQDISGGSSAVMKRANSDAYLVFYPEGEEGNERSRRILRHTYLVQLTVGADVKAFQKRHGILKVEMLYPEKGLAVCTEASTAKVLTQLSNVAEDPQVRITEPLFARQKFVRRIPTDPYYAFPGVDDNYQWYLNNDGSNNGVADIDINLEAALDLSTGANVGVAIIDDGFFSSHSDLTNFLPDFSFNLNGGDPDDAEPQSVLESHGTSVASLLGATFDDEGMSGVAPEAILAGVRLIAEPSTDQQEALALSFSNPNADPSLSANPDVSNNSWGPSDFETTLEPIGPLAQAAIETEAVTGGNSATGTIFVWAGGNGAENNDNSNYDGYANLPETIAVGAITDQGVRAPYSEMGANLVISAPSDGGGQGVVAATIDQEVDPVFGLPAGPIFESYTSEFGGTSAAAPLVSGVAALMKSIRPDLGWRDVQEILMQTAVQVDSNSGEWIENGAGFTFNHEYGAGMVNAEAAVQAASTWSALPDKGEALTLLEFPVADIPDGNGDSYVLTFDLSEEPNRRVEHVQLRTTIVSDRRADLDIVLISPNGTQSILAEAHSNSDEQSISDWTFMTVRNWGEGSAGTWVLRVTDRNAGDLPSRLNNAQIIIHGPEDADAPILQSPLLVSNRVVSGVQGVPLIYNLETLGGTDVSVVNLPDGLVYNAATGIVSGVPASADFFDASVTITGPSGTIIVTLAFIIEPTQESLGSAVGVPARTSISGGDLPWDFNFDTFLSEGNSAASPEELEDNQESVFGFSSVPESVARFSWRVSSESNPETSSYDRLWFQVGGGDLPSRWSAFIDGEKDWAEVAVRLPGRSDIRWIYQKNVAEPNPVDPENTTDSVGDDRGFVDDVELVDYDTYLKEIEDAANINFDFEMESKTLWIPVADVLAPDGEAIRSSGVGNGQTVSMGTWVEGPATISLDYRTSTNAGDVLEILVNGIVYNDILTPALIGSGTSPAYSNTSGDIPVGMNFVEIRYRKDFSSENVVDAVWLDNISIIPASTMATWAAENGLGTGALNEDPDNDGYSNAEEYAFGGNPLVADVPANVPRFTTDGINRWFEFGIDQSITDISYTLQESSDLEIWSDSDSFLGDRTEGTVDYFRLPVFAGSAAKFYRLHAAEAE